MIRTPLAILLGGMVGAAMPGAMVGQGPDRRTEIVNEGWRLVGDLVEPSRTIPGRTSPAVLLLNGAGRDRSDYTGLARALAHRGIGSIRLDLRGSGASTNLGRFVPFDSTGHNDSLRLDRSWSDVRAALRFLATQPWVDSSRLGALGASFSGEALAQAIRGGGAPRAVVALSPGSLSDSSLALVDRDGRRWMFVYSSREMIIRRHEMDRRTRRGTVRARVVVVPDSAHASALLDRSPFLPERIAEWFSRALDAEGADGRWREAAGRVAALLEPGWDDLRRPGGRTAFLGDGEAGRLHFLTAWHRSVETGASRHAVQRSASRLVEAIETTADSASGSLYVGIAGPAFVLLEASEILRDPALEARARLLLDQLRRNARIRAGGVTWSAFNDVLFGDAGTVALLASAAQSLADTALANLTRAGARGLIGRGRPDSAGRSWRVRETGPFELPNFSHGAAGVGTVLAMIGRDPSAPAAFLDAALAAGRYVRAVAQRDAQGFRVPYGWPVPEGGWGRPFDASWAHGQAGTARLFWELWRATRDTSHLAVVNDAVVGLDSARVLTGPASGYGAEPFGTDYRFGLAGIADLFADLYDETGDRAHLDRALVLAMAMLARADSATGPLGWSGPRRAFMADPGTPALFTGLLHGAVGPGLVFLKLDALLHGMRPPPALPDSPFGDRE